MLDCHEALTPRSAFRAIRFPLLAAAIATFGALAACDRAPTASSAPAGGAAVVSTAGTDFQIPISDVSSWPSPARSAFEELRGEFRTDPRNPDLVINIGALFFVHGKPQDALACFERARALIPEHEVGHYYAGLGYDKAGQPDKAIEAFGAAVTRATDNPEIAAAWFRTGILLSEKDPPRARAAFQESLKLIPGDARVYAALAKLAKATGNNQEAYDYYRKAIEIAPIYSEAQQEAAQLAQALGKSDEAAAHSRKAAAGGRTPPVIDPMYARLLDAGMDLTLMIQMALRATEERDFERAEERLIKAMAMDTGEGARVALATLRLRQGKLDEAFSLARGLVDAKPASGPGNGILGEILLAQRKNAEALECIRKAIAADANDARAHYFLGLALRRGNDTAGAKSAFEQALRILPTFTRAYEALIEYALKARDYAEAERLLRAGLDRSPGAARLANTLAWQLAACPDPARRKPEESLKWARQACEQAEFRSFEFVDTLAVAFAATGDFENAAKACQDAIRLVKEAPGATQAEKDSLAKLVTEFEARLKLFEAKQAYVDPA